MSVMGSGKGPLRCLVLAGVLSLQCAVFPALAQTATVQSGEHSEFSRLVIDIGPDRTWEISRDGNDAIITFSPSIATFDVQRVFQLIPRTRLTDVSSDEGLILSLGCACGIATSRFQGRYLIVDVSDPSPGTPIEGETATTAEEPVADLGARLMRDGVAAESLPNLTSIMLQRPSLQQVPDVTSPMTDLLPETSSESEPPNAILQDAARIMAEQLARAAASGLLDAAQGRPMMDADPIRSTEVVEPPQNPVEVAPENPVSATDLRNMSETPVELLRLPIRAETSIDAALHRSISAEPQQNVLSCNSRLSTLSDWSAGAGVDQGLGALRRNLYDLQNDLRPDGVLRIAQHYIYYGFGAEAAFWLRQLETPPAELLALAAIVDGVEGPRLPAFEDALQCSDEEFLWRYLDARQSLDLTEEQSGRLQRATAALPTGLRDQIAPRTAVNLHRDGFIHAARNLRDMLVRGGRIPSNSLLILDLELGIANSERPDDAREALALALRDDGGDTALMMAHALAFDRATEQPITDTRLTAAEALLRESETSASKPELWLEVVLAHARRSDIDRVLELLDDPELATSIRMEALTQLFIGWARERDTASLLILTRVHGAGWIAEGSDAGRARVSTISLLRSVGLVEAAEVLRDTQRPLILPARPNTLASDVEAHRIAWQTSDWQEVSLIAGGPHQAVADRMLNRSEALGDADSIGTDLSGVLGILEDTRDLRAEIAALLVDPSPSPQDVTQ